MPQRARTVKTIYLLLGMSPSEALREGGLNIKGIVKPFTSVERIGSKPGFVLSCDPHWEEKQSQPSLRKASLILSVEFAIIH